MTTVAEPVKTESRKKRSVPPNLLAVARAYRGEEMMDDDARRPISRIFRNSWGGRLDTVERHALARVAGVLTKQVGVWEKAGFIPKARQERPGTPAYYKAEALSKALIKIAERND